MSGLDDSSRTAVTFDACGHVVGPFFHGTRASLQMGDELVPGRTSNFHAGRVMNHIYFTALLETAVWGAELATALAGNAGPGHVYRWSPPAPSRTTRT